MGGPSWAFTHFNSPVGLKASSVTTGEVGSFHEAFSSLGIQHVDTKRWHQVSWVWIRSLVCKVGPGPVGPWCLWGEEGLRNQEGHIRCPFQGPGMSFSQELELHAEMLPSFP